MSFSLSYPLEINNLSDFYAVNWDVAKYQIKKAEMVHGIIID